MHVIESFYLKSKIALVTGGAGLYGRQIAEALAEAGAETYIASRNLSNLEALANELRSKGLNVHALELDLSVEESIKKAVDTIVKETGRLDILVNNAVTRCALFGWDRPMSDFDESLHTNASALFYITNLAGKVMITQKNGSIINIGSMMGMVGVELANYDNTEYPTDFSPIYFYEKGGMVNFTRWAASMFGRYNVRVNCINPGGFQTEKHPETFVKQYSARTQLGRMANSEDLKGIIVLLASDASNYITGANIPVDGGYTAK
jgi:NAD(P)-dependent dehydrogenase (short-subunit alcohol dehydrogenase family)